MTYYIANPKGKDANNMWQLQDIDTGEIISASTDEIKHHLHTNDIKIINLKLSTDDKLIQESQFHFDTQSVEAIRNAPEILKRFGLKAATLEERDYFDASLDKMMADCIKYVNDLSYEDNISAMMLNKDKNLFQIRIKTKDFYMKKDEYITFLVRYEQLFYGTCNPLQDNTIPCVCGDIMLGIRALRMPNGDVINFNTGFDRLSAYLANTYTMQDDYKKYCGNVPRTVILSDELYVRKVHQQYFFCIDTTKKAQNDGHLFALNSQFEVSRVATAMARCLGVLVGQMCDKNGIKSEGVFYSITHAIMPDGHTYADFSRYRAYTDPHYLEDRLKAEAKEIKFTDTPTVTQTGKKSSKKKEYRRNGKTYKKSIGGFFDLLTDKICDVLDGIVGRISDGIDTIKDFADDYPGVILMTALTGVLGIVTAISAGKIGLDNTLAYSWQTFMPMSVFGTAVAAFEAADDDEKPAVLAAIQAIGIACSVLNDSDD